MQRACGQQSSLHGTSAPARPIHGRALRMPITTASLPNAASSRPISGAVPGNHITTAPKRTRNVSAGVSILQRLKKAEPSTAGNYVTYDVTITYYDPWADLNALDCNWSITKLVDRETGDYAPQNTVSDYVDKDHGPHNGLELDIRHTKVSVPPGFQPGAVVLTATDGFLVKGRHAFIHQITLKPSGGGPELVFSANTYISASQGERIVFEGTPSLRSETPSGLGKLRDAELLALKGGPPSVRKGNERVYQFDVYNDLGGDPSNPFAVRPPLGGSAEYPYPRRIRTGRPLYPSMKPPTETSGGIPWLPLDDGFNDQKSINFLSNAVASLIPAIVDRLISAVLKDDSNVFADIKSVLSLYYDSPAEVKPQSGKGGEAPDLALVIGNIVEDVLKGGFIGALVPDVVDGGKDGLLKRLKELLLQATRFALPLVLKDRVWQWEKDEELGRQLLAGQNPMTIVALNSQADLDNLTKAGSTLVANEAAFKNQLEGKSLSQLMGLPKPHLFVVDHATIIQDYLSKVNGVAVQTGTLHAARGLFYLRDTGYLVPVAIEMKSDEAQPFTVYTPNMAKPIWRLCKAIFSSLDSGSHQLVSHWLRTHCCVEPYLIATRRSLSEMHPVFKLMMPHYRYTMAINAAARALLINVDGVIEKGFTPGRYSMEMSSKVYGADWRFDEQGLPADLKKRGVMAPNGELLVDDYPYAQDGLLIWSALEKYFGEYLSLYYKSDADVANDTELQAWWEDIKGPSGGHADKANSPGWPALNSKSNLVFALATIAWSASGHHAAVNFDQYDYSGFMPNRSSAVVKAMPLPGSADFKRLANQAPGSAESEKEFLSYLSPLSTTLKVMTTLKLLSSHSDEEQYLLAEQETLGWLTDDRVKPVHDNFLKDLQAAAEEVDRRNSSGEYKTRYMGDCGIPYTLMLPTSGPGVTGRGVPYSISI